MNTRLRLFGYAGLGVLLAVALVLGSLVGTNFNSAYAQDATPTPVAEADPTPVAPDEPVTTDPMPMQPGQMGTMMGHMRTITVVGEGTARLSPDIAQATIGVDVVADTVQEATQEASETMEAVMDALSEAGIADEDMQTTGYNIWVERGFAPAPGPAETEPATGEQVRYHVTNNVSVIIRDIDDIGNVLNAAIEAGANNIFGVNFAVDDVAEFRTQARNDAVENARERAEELAGLTGTQVGRVISISEVIGQPGIPFATAQMADGLGGGAGPISPGQLQFTERIQITYELQ